VDNITHSLVGVALADLAMGRPAKTQRPIFVGAGIIAANLPDVDVAYSGITASPLGYLLHHRGHTHTLVGLVVLALVLVLTYWFFPSVRRMNVLGRIRFWLLIAVALASHLALDSLNSYGVHPFYPFDNTWYFGDAVFILEPWLWLVFGVAAAWNGRSGVARLAVALPMLVLLAATVSMRMIPLESAAALAVGGAAFAWFAHRLSPPMRAAAALVLCGALACGLLATSRLARAAAVDALRADLTGKVADVVLTPNPSSPLCWGVIVIEMREAQGEYVLWRGTLSLSPAWKRPAACASQKFVGAREMRVVGDGRFALRDNRRQSLGHLRELAERDCRVNAWLRFGRAPVIEGGSIYDLRFAERFGQDFSSMRLNPRSDCPANVPGWSMPRADLLQ
jgi:inner membrane protein